MKVKDMFPSRYASGSDLDGKQVTLTINMVRGEQVRDNKTGQNVNKYILYFVEAKKGVILNRTTSTQIAAALGLEDSNDWHGKRITLYPATIDAFGKRHTVVHFRQAAPVKAGEVTAAPQAMQTEVAEAEEEEF